jgi:hypothetical protein
MPPNSDRLQMIQAIITRLAGNSGAIKGFTVPVVTALLGVSINSKNGAYAWLGIFPVVVFGFIDAYYLALERRFRKLYERAIGEADTKWDLDAGKATFGDILRAVKSLSVWAFYGATLVAVIIVAVIV